MTESKKADQTRDTIVVDRDALHRVLSALVGPGHYISELQVTRGPLFDNPIDKLVAQFNAGGAESTWTTEETREWVSELRRAHVELDQGKPFFSGKDCAELADLIEQLSAKRPVVPDPDGPGTPSARLHFLLSELEKRFPGVVDPFSSEPSEPKLLAALDQAQERPGTAHEE